MAPVPDGNAAVARVCPSCGARYDASARFCVVDRAPLHDAAAPASEDPLLGTLIADKYLVERKLGEGGMGRVYLATQLPINRSVALKVMRADAMAIPDARARFTREARAMSVVAHPNIIQIHDSGDLTDGLAYIAMEYVDGEALSTVIARDGALQLRRTASILLQVASALAAAHNRQIIHRDLKPENILLGRTPTGDDHVKVVDFGIARALQEDSLGITSTGLVLGTPAYMSPEQLTGERVDARTDVYTLALVTCKMLTGALPFPTAPSDLGARLTKAPTPLSTLAPQSDWPPQAQEALAGALRVDPAERTATTLEFAEALVDALAAWRPHEFVPPPFLPGLSIRTPSTGPRRIVTPPSPHPAISGRRYAVIGAVVATVFIGTTGWLLRSSEPVVQDHDSIADSVVTTVDSTPTKPSTPGQVTVADSNTQGTLAGGKLPTSPEGPADTKTPTTVHDTTVAVGTTAPPVQATPPADTTPPAPPPPQEGWVRIGSRNEAVLYIDGELRGPVPSLRYFKFPAGHTVNLRLRTEGCQDWDTTLTVRTDTARVGYKRPRC